MRKFKVGDKVALLQTNGFQITNYRVLGYTNNTDNSTVRIQHKVLSTVLEVDESKLTPYESFYRH